MLNDTDGPGNGVAPPTSASSSTEDRRRTMTVPLPHSVALPAMPVVALTIETSDPNTSFTTHRTRFPHTDPARVLEKVTSRPKREKEIRGSIYLASTPSTPSTSLGLITHHSLPTSLSTHPRQKSTPSTPSYPQRGAVAVACVLVRVVKLLVSLEERPDLDPDLDRRTDGNTTQSNANDQAT
jgi:hypothetical protein